MNPTIALDENDKKTKKTWLKLTVFRLIVFPLIQIVFILLTFFIEPFSFKELIPSGIMFLVCLLFFFGLYRCAYQKFGNKFLFFSVVDGIIGIQRAFTATYNEPFNLFSWSIFALLAATFVAWVIYSEKVKKINKECRRHLKELAQL